MTPFDVVLACAAVARLTRLVTVDSWPFGALRGRVVDVPWFGDLVTCSWCASVWIAASWVTLWTWEAAGAVWTAASIVLACSLVAGVVASFTD